MPYIERDESNDINSTFARPQFQGQEYLAESHLDFVAFLATRNAVEYAKVADRADLRQQVQDFDPDTIDDMDLSQLKNLMKVYARLFKAIEKRI